MSGAPLPALTDPGALDGPIALAESDPAWPALFAGEARKVRGALGPAVLELHHAGSTSVAGLAAKPIIDMILVLGDSTDEAAYVPPLEAAGYALRIREPDWLEHRMLRGADPVVNLHVYSAGCPEVARMLAFRDHLRADDADRRLYEETKRALAARSWRFVQDYADAKTEVVNAIMERALAGRGPQGPAGGNTST